MEFYGWNKTTLLDYPGHVAATLFTGGCNLRCPFCHNKDLVILSGPGFISQEEALAFLTKRKSVLEGICITGGEPTAHADLPDFIRKVKELGYLVKLDTNGTAPEVLEMLMTNRLLDYVAMDVKACRENYCKATGTETVELEKIQKSIELLQKWDKPAEFRTTMVKGIHRPEEAQEIAEWIGAHGKKPYYIQSYRENENVICPGYSAFDKEELENMVRLATLSGVCASLRGVD